MCAYVHIYFDTFFSYSMILLPNLCLCSPKHSSSKKTLRIWAIFLLGKCSVLHISSKTLSIVPTSNLCWNIQMHNKTMLTYFKTSLAAF